MGANHRFVLGGLDKDLYPAVPFTPTDGNIAPVALLASTASPAAAQAEFGGKNRIISGPVSGPISSNGGAITVT
jgi:hypothetical protein